MVLAKSCGLCTHTRGKRRAVGKKAGFVSLSERTQQSKRKYQVGIWRKREHNGKYCYVWGERRN